MTQKNAKIKLSVMLGINEADEITKMAKASGKSVSSMARFMLRHYINFGVHTGVNLEKEREF